MKLMINIPDEAYELLKNKLELDNIAESIIANGTPVSAEGDLISRKALKEDINSLYEYDTYNEEFDAGIQSILNFIDNAPTVETSKIEHKAYNEGFKDGVDQGIKLSASQKGKWIDCKDIPYLANCSICGYQMDTHEERGYFNYCPYCGADMKGDAK